MDYYKERGKSGAKVLLFRELLIKDKEFKADL
jgi:hypothetical protein